MKCHYCGNECEGFVFEQVNLIVIAHRNCAEEKLEKDGKL
jgi:hypothetical protein